MNNREKTDEELLEMAERSKRKVAESFNGKGVVNTETKLIIVGTITPKTANHFYCSSYNRIYGLIDEAISEIDPNENIQLKELKKGLSKPRWNAKDKTELSGKELDNRINQINSFLLKHQIAFLDVIKHVIRKEGKECSPSDDDIEFYSLDYDAFKNIENPTIIANSQFANECLLDILDKNHSNASPILLSQRIGSRDKWVTAIKQALK